MKANNKIALGYKDVFLVPNKCTLRSRKEANTSYTQFLGEIDVSSTEDTFRQIKKTLPLFKHFKLPIIPANMKSVVDHKTYEKYVELGLMPIMHRFDVDMYSFLSGVNREWRAVSVGVSNKDLIQLERVSSKLSINQQPHLICIDIAHGHSDAILEMVQVIKTLFTELPPVIMAGNVTTPEAVEDLQRWGVDIIKVGIGPGQVCSTKNKTGFHVPMFTAVKECAAVAKVPIVADGGIRENGDIVKALVAGADLVMIGGLFAACTDSPAAIIDGKKEYYGSASMFNKGYNRNIEGFAIHLNPTMSIEEKVEEIHQDLQSAISYSGGKDLSALDLSRVKYNIVM